MKKLITIIAVATIAVSSFARPGHRPPPPPRYHHHHHHAGVVTAASVVGFAIGAATAYAQQTPVYVREPVVVQTPVQPVYVAPTYGTPTYYTSNPTPVAHTAPLYVNGVQVVGQSVTTVEAGGYRVVEYVHPTPPPPQEPRRTLVPAHYEYRNGVQVFVPAHYEIAVR